MDKKQNFLLQTGYVCHQWSYLEYLFSKAIWHLLSLDKEMGMIVTGGMDILPRANMAITLANHKKADRALVDALKEARKSIQSRLQDDRNRVVHGVYSSHTTNPNAPVMIETHRGKGDRTRKPITAAEVHAIGKQINETSMALTTTLESFGIKCD
jgi:hypothetical protein